MTKRIHFLIVFNFGLSTLCSATEPGNVLRRLELSLLLTEFPVAQKHLWDFVGIPPTARPWWGSWDERGKFNVYDLCLSNNNGGGTYAVRIHYGAFVKDVDPADCPITDVELLFIGPKQLTFRIEPSKSLLNMIPDLRSNMIRKKLSPKVFAEAFYKESQEVDIQEPSEPNKSL